MLTRFLITMQTALTLLAALLLAPLATLAQERQTPPWITPAVRAPRVELRTFKSKAAKSAVSFHVFTPEMYDTEMERRFPVLYWLHGTSGGLPGIAPLSAFFDRAMRDGNIPPMLIVFPNGLVASMWCDSKDGAVPMETVVVKELVPHVDATFRTLAGREGRILEGFSMGGYGAARLGLKYPEVFGAVSILAGGPLDLELHGPRATANPDGRARILKDTFGGDMGYYKAQSPITAADLNAANVRGKVLLRQAVGSRDFSAALNRSFSAHLERLNIEHTFTEVPGVSHDTMALLRGLGDANWEFYRTALGDKPAAKSAQIPLGAVHSPTAWLDTVPFTGGKEGYACYRCPTLAVSTQGTVLAFCEGRVNGHKDEDDMDVVLKRSTDGGRTWGPLQVLANDGKNPCKNECPVVLPSGRILLVWLWNRWIPAEKDRTTREAFVMHSDDDGVSWSKPRNITKQVYREGWRWYGTGPCHGIVKRSEPHRGRVVIAARHNTEKTHMFTHAIYSDDGGETWQIGGNVQREKTSEATVVELNSGDLMLNCRNQNDGENYRVVSVSKDGGATFSETWLERQLVEPRGCQASLLFHSPNPATGKGNILFSNPANATVRSDGTLKLSEDDGRTWTRAFRYGKKPAPNFTGYSDIAVMLDGSVGILYERGDLDDASRKADRYDEVGFTVVPFAEIRTPLSPTPTRGSTK